MQLANFAENTKMEKKDKLYTEVEAKFLTKNESQVMNALHDIRMHGKASVLPLVFALLQSKPSETIIKEIFALLGQLKDKKCVPYIISELESAGTLDFRTELIASCWQSGLDYSEHLTTFANQFISGSYKTAIECISVIEESIHNASNETLEACKNLLLDSLKSISEDKKPLYLELVKIVESYM
jgi:hypothetical protein